MCAPSALIKFNECQVNKGNFKRKKNSKKQNWFEGERNTEKKNKILQSFFDQPLLTGQQKYTI